MPVALFPLKGSKPNKFAATGNAVVGLVREKKCRPPDYDPNRYHRNKPVIDWLVFFYSFLTPEQIKNPNMMLGLQYCRRIE